MDTANDPIKAVEDDLEPYIELMLDLAEIMIAMKEQLTREKDDADQRHIE